MVEIRYSKRDKPYLVCNPCGVQVFIRGSHGISRLDRWKKASTLLPAGNSASQPSAVIPLVEELEKLKVCLKKAEADAPWPTLFTVNPAVEALNNEIEKIENKLREIYENKN